MDEKALDEKSLDEKWAHGVGLLSNRLLLLGNKAFPSNTVGTTVLHVFILVIFTSSRQVYKAGGL